MSCEKSTRKEYELRINRAIDYIAENLTNPLNLQEISEAASFSPYHFHRIFKAITGETINSFVNRVRCAKSACLLVYNDDCSLSEIALMSGFSSSAAFSRSFREYFAVTPSEYRSGGWKKISKICKNESKNWKDFLSIRPYSVGVFDEPSRRRWKEMKVEIKTLPDYRVAYMRHIGPYGPGGIQETWKKLGNWMLGRDLWKESSVMLGISHDDPHIVPAEKCRYDACVVIDEDYETGNSVNTTEIKGVNTQSTNSKDR